MSKKTPRVSKSEFERIRDEFLAERGELMANLFAEQEQNTDVHTTIVVKTKESVVQDVDRVCNQVHAYSEKMSRRKADEHRQARLGFKVIVPEHHTTPIEYRHKLVMIKGGGKGGAWRTARNLRNAFEVIENTCVKKFTDIHRNGIDYFYECGALKVVWNDR